MASVSVRSGRRRWRLLLLWASSVASMFLGDAMITPAISVLSAVEGLKLAPPHLKHYVAAAGGCDSGLLVSVQSRGTAMVASAFAPVMIIWFADAWRTGFDASAMIPAVMCAINPITRGRISAYAWQ